MYFFVPCLLRESENEEYNYRSARAAVQYSRSRCQVHVTTAVERGVLTSAPAVPQLMSEFIMQIARLRDCESSFLC